MIDIEIYVVIDGIKYQIQAISGAVTLVKAPPPPPGPVASVDFKIAQPGPRMF